MRGKKITSTLTAFALLSSSAMADVSYTVQKGDSYWNIAKRFNTSMESVMDANPESSSSYLITGQIIKIPSNTYTAQKGDTYYLIAKKCGVSLSSLLSANGKTSSSVLYPGQTVTIPDSGNGYTTYTVQKGDTYWIISQKYGVSLSDLLSANNATNNTLLNIGDKVKIPSSSGTGSSGNTNSGSSGSPSSGPYVTYDTYTVQNGDTFWNIAIKHGIPYSELLQVNSLSQSSKIYAGMKLTIPVHHVPVKYAPQGYGELLEWFSEAQYVVPINTDFKVVDLATGKSFNARRTVGSGHADCETLTAKDTAIMKEIWGGNFSWNKRSVLIVVNGRTIAASAAGMMHAGNDGAPGGEWTSWRSDNYGEGINYDYIKGNNAHGHFDLHFYKSIGHSSGVESSAHQANVLKSAGR
ncbi:MAG: LysM peptidoglycan-binding domain-containing protein [Clostridia bacterium]|nr:LysM peptidoglycan-binding domain-containing protein [Clostridia bacterium]